MSWSQENHTITFYCDTCDKSTEIDTVAHRTHLNLSMSDYVVAESRVPDRLALKRANHDWTHYCAGCADQAEREHEDYQRQEAIRERIKARNA